MGLQDELARDIAEEIRVTLTPAALRHLASGRAANPQAYDAYLQGRYFWNRRTEPELKKRKTISNKRLGATRVTRRPIRDWQIRISICPMRGDTWHR